MKTLGLPCLQMIPSCLKQIRIPKSLGNTQIIKPYMYSINVISYANMDYIYKENVLYLM